MLAVRPAGPPGRGPEVGHPRRDRRTRGTGSRRGRRAARRDRRADGFSSSYAGRRCHFTAREPVTRRRRRRTHARVHAPRHTLADGRRETDGLVHAERRAAGRAENGRDGRARRRTVGPVVAFGRLGGDPSPRAGRVCAARTVRATASATRSLGHAAVVRRR